MNENLTRDELRKRLLLINGPNLNMLGFRERVLYGSRTLDEIVAAMTENAKSRGYNLSSIQSNSEGQIVDVIQKSRNSASFILINAGAYTHSSIAIRDALLAVSTPFIELHMSNVYSRESFRHRSLLSDIAEGVIVGFGDYSYTLALDAAIQFLVREGETDS